MTRHARQVHNGPKPLSCPYCEYKTADRSNFKKHVELHLNPRQFLCPLCKYAASKKCNLQYHIKSRHSGCDVALDVSKVKLRVKKSGPDLVVDDASDARLSKLEDSSAVEEDGDDGSDGEQSPINLSVRKSGRSNVDQLVQKPNGPPEKQQKMMTRQKKVDESPAENMTSVKRRVRKAPADRTEELTQNQQNPTDASQNQETQPEPKITSEKSDKNPRKSRKSSCKRSEKNLDHTKERSPKPDGSEKNQKPKEGREKPAKRKPTEVLDLSQKSSKSRRLKSPDQKPPSKCTPPEPESSPSAGSDRAKLPKQKKVKNGGKKGPALKLTVAPEGLVQSKNPTASSMEDGPPEQMEAPPSCSRPPGPEPAASAPAFLKPTLPPRSKPTDPEDDEGIHSSHEGGSDISDSASEGSDDSGLNGAGAIAKMANDPETPTEEIPTPTELQSHTCIFCDRTFPLEAVYRRHLNRHLVNVYYLDAAKAQK